MSEKKPVNNPPESQAVELTFEQIVERLEQIVRRLEEGQPGLSESLERYEEGVKLLRQAYELLEKAERKIELLSGIDEQGNPITTPFDDSATFDPGQPGQSPGTRRQKPRKGDARRAE